MINCNNCTNNCCGNPCLTPVLLPVEEARFKNLKTVTTPYGEIKLLSKKENGSCIFLDDKSAKCMVYEDRPLECRIYPFLLDFSKERFDIKLDCRFCPNISTLMLKKDDIDISSYEFQDWRIKAYESLQDC